MASLHNFNHQVGVAFGNIGQKIKSFAEVAGAVKGIVDTGIFLKNTLAPVATVAAALV
tara:strand:+ start:126 stop:299 length:174 start_codon:yes stop_codon:yes gene_type:complete